MNNFVSLRWIAGGNCPVKRGNPFSSSTSFERDNINGLKMKEIKLTQGKIALVDDEDYEYLNQWKWYAAKAPHTFYAARGVNRKGKWTSEKMHRVLFDIPAGKEIDHINHNGLDNRRSNLRIVTTQQNSLNVSAFGSSRYLGVCVYEKNGHRYIVAHIKHNGKNIHIGHFPTEEAAALAYNELAARYHGEYANLNKLTER
jgi:hypothetical protein